MVYPQVAGLEHFGAKDRAFATRRPTTATSRGCGAG